MSSPSGAPSALVDLPDVAATHFTLWFYAAVVRVLTCVLDRFDSWDALFERFPFLAYYNNEIARCGIGGVEASVAPARWLETVLAREAATDAHLPLRALRRAAALEPDAIALLMTIGLPDEDPRFGEVFDLLQGEIGQKRPTAGLLAAWWDGAPAATSARAQARHLHELGLIQPLQADRPRSEWSFQVPAAIWDAARGGASRRARDRTAPYADRSAGGLRRARRRRRTHAIARASALAHRRRRMRRGDRPRPASQRPGNGRRRAGACARAGRGRDSRAAAARR